VRNREASLRVSTGCGDIEASFSADSKKGGTGDVYLCPKNIYFIKRGSITIIIILKIYFMRVTGELKHNYVFNVGFNKNETLAERTSSIPFL